MSLIYIILYILFAIIFIGVFAYSMLYLKGIQKIRKEIGLKPPLIINSFLLLSLILSLVSVAFISVALIQELFFLNYLS